MSEPIENQLKDVEAECSRLFRNVKKLEKELGSAKEKYLQANIKLKNLRSKKLHEETKEKIGNLSHSLDSEWIDQEFGWTEKIKKLLKDKFHLDSFRSKQLAAINATLSNKDVLLVMPTGGGKSLVYQLTALVSSGLTIVVSPLISLIEDQLIALRRLEINVNTIHGGTPKEEIKQIHEQISDKNSNLKLLYVTPEWVAKSKRFLAVLKKAYENNRIARVAIDEVHCCSTWGHDFRPDYGYLGLLRKMLSKVPFLGLTATATVAVLNDVQTMLCLENCLIITAPFNRPNLFYKVLPKPSTKEATLNYLENLLKQEYSNQTGIIYTTTVNDSCNLANDLKSRGIKIAPYHAQLEHHQKKEIHRKWIEKRYQVIVATVAFGMGIDVPDVRFVIHHTIPKSMENLYQESGRAGRDGQKADCIVLFGLNDYFKVLGMVSSVVEEKKALQTLEYCLDTKRRALIATHFEEVWEESQCKEMCDHCTNTSQETFFYDLTETCEDLYKLIENASNEDEKLTLNKLLDGWFQSGPKKLRISTLKVPKISRQQGEVAISFLLLNGYLGIDKGYTTYSTICYIVKGKTPRDTIKMSSTDRYPGFPKIYADAPPQKKVKLDD